MFDTAILKLTARCNLNCTYCYMFNLEDQTFRRVPPRMPIETALTVLSRIQDHVQRHTSDRPFTIVLHGGEPSLWPERSFQMLLERIAAMRADGVPIRVAMQSNGIRLRPSLLEILAAHDVKIGISLDGPQVLNDVYRRTHRGQGSYARVMRTLSEMIEKGYARLLSGVLAVGEPSVPPAEFLDWLAGLPVPRADVLWPIQFNYANPPWPANGREEYLTTPRYGRWFADLFDEWWRRDDPSVSVRLFVDSISVILGGTKHADCLVNDRIGSFVVNTDGVLEYSDYFRAARDGGPRSSFDVFSSELDELTHDPVFDYCLNLRSHLPVECATCPHVKLCGGGFLPGRMNPVELLPSKRSILCADMYYFFARVQRRVAAARPVELDANSYPPRAGGPNRDAPEIRCLPDEPLVAKKRLS
jgi:uncharacterized protein